MHLDSPSLSIESNGTLRLLKQVSSFDGDKSQSLNRNRKGAWTLREYPEPRIADSISLQMHPIMCCLRLSNPNVCGVSLRKFRVEKSDAEFAGRRCIVLEGPGARLYIDPERDFVVVRFESAHAKRPLSHQIDVDYRLDESLGWIPEKWGIRRFDPDGAALETIEATVTGFARTANLERSDFQIEIPAGTRVYDGRSRRTMIIQADGARVPAPDESAPAEESDDP
jgi:hypothetical protein